MSMTNFIHVPDLNSAWYTALWSIWEKGRAYHIDRGSYAGEKRICLDSVVIEVDNPRGGNILPVLPPALSALNPVDSDQVEAYASYILESVVAENETYTYGSRISESLERVISQFNEYGPGNNQGILQIAKPSDVFCPDPPCLRHVDMKIIGNTLNFYLYFRSWEAYAGLPTNLAGLGYLLDYVVERLQRSIPDLTPGKFICHSKCLHLYSHMLGPVNQVLKFPTDRRTIEKILGGR